MLSSLAELPTGSSFLVVPVQGACVVFDLFEFHTILLRQRLALAHAVYGVRNFVSFKNALELVLPLTNTGVCN